MYVCLASRISQKTTCLNEFSVYVICHVYQCNMLWTSRFVDVTVIISSKQTPSGIQDARATAKLPLVGRAVVHWSRALLLAASNKPA